MHRREVSLIRLTGKFRSLRSTLLFFFPHLILAAILVPVHLMNRDDSPDAPAITITSKAIFTVVAFFHVLRVTFMICLPKAVAAFVEVRAAIKKIGVRRPNELKNRQQLYCFEL